MSYPTKADREKCWNAKDKYWICLEENNEKREACLKTRKEYEKCCSAQWVKHFDRRRKYEKFKEEMASGEFQDPLDQKR